MGEQAVSSVVGTTLMLGITVTVFAALGVTMLAYFAAQPHPPRSDVSIAHDASLKTYVVTHHGGEGFTVTGAKALINVGGTTTEAKLSSLTGASALGTTWDLGESLCIQGTDSSKCTYTTSQDVRGVFIVSTRFVVASEGTLGTTTVTSSCPTDVAAPTVSSWTQSPSNVQTTTTGSVLITVVLTDACHGVDQTTNPVLSYSIDSGTPSYTTVGSMTLTSTSTWQGTIPSQTWSSLQSKILRTCITGQKDLGGNTAGSTCNATTDTVDNACASDLLPPTVSTWTQSPTDIAASTATGTATITAVLTDTCYGVNESSSLKLWYAIDTTATGSGSTTWSTATATMTKTTTSTWQGTIPSQTWSTLGGKYLHYYITGMSDTGGNTQSAFLSANAKDELIDVASVLDPGFAYVDTNNNGAYDSGDSTISTSALQTGTYSTSGSNGLVIPSSVGPISAGTIGYTSGGLMYIGVPLTSTTGGITLTGGTSVTVASGNTVQSAGSLNIDPTTSFTGDGATFKASGSISIGDTNPGQLGTAVSLVGSTVDNTAGTSSLNIQQQSGTTDLTNAQIKSKGAIDIGGGNGGHQALNIVASGATIDNTGGTSSITFHDITGSITASGASTQIKSKGAITMPAGTSMDISSATLDNTGGTSSIDLTAGTTMTATGTTVSTKGQLTLTATGSITASSATLSNTGGTSSLTVQSTGGSVTLSSASLATKSTMTVSAASGLTLTSASLDSSLGTGTMSLTTSSGAVLCNPCTVSSANDITMSGATFTGTGMVLTTTGSGSRMTLSSTGAFAATGAKMTSTGRISISGVATTLTNACGTTSGSGQDIILSGGSGALSMAGPSSVSGCTTWAASGAITLSGSSITVDSARFSTSGSGQTLSASAGAISATSTIATTTGSQSWTASANAIDFTSATLNAGSNNLAANVPSGCATYKVTVVSSTFVDGNNKLDVTPNSCTTGTPTSGGLE